ncbi:MAG: HAD family hydrolase [Magnetospiraceae bacterium]
MTILYRDPQPPKAVLFDWDSTLVDNWVSIQSALNTVFAARGMPLWSREQVIAEATNSQRDKFPKLFGADWQDARDLFVAHLETHHLDSLQTLEGAESLLQTLQDQGIPTAVVSNKSGAFLRRECTHLGWDPYFRTVLGAADAVRDKPAPDPVFLALSKMNLAAGDHIWFVGDTDVDMACAHAAGCYAILVRPHPPRTGEFDAAPVACYVNSRWELASLLGRIARGAPAAPYGGGR